MERINILDANSEDGYREPTAIELSALAYIDLMREHILSGGEVQLMKTNNCDLLAYIHRLVKIV